MSGSQVLLDTSAVARSVRRIAAAILEQVGGIDRLGLVGIQRGGVPLARQIVAEIKASEGAAAAVPTGTVDITLYRDDASTALPNPRIGPSDVPFSIDDRHIVLVDDVLQTGRTVRAAIDCLLDYGRPRRIWLAALCDRGGRELPITADFVGKVVEVPLGTRVEAHLDDWERAQVIATRAEGT